MIFGLLLPLLPSGSQTSLEHLPLMTPEAPRALGSMFFGRKWVIYLKLFHSMLCTHTYNYIIIIYIYTYDYICTYFYIWYSYVTNCMSSNMSIVFDDSERWQARQELAACVQSRTDASCSKQHSERNGAIVTCPWLHLVFVRQLWEVCGSHFQDSNGHTWITWRYTLILYIYNIYNIYIYIYV